MCIIGHMVVGCLDEYLEALFEGFHCYVDLLLWILGFWFMLKYYSRDLGSFCVNLSRNIYLPGDFVHGF